MSEEILKALMQLFAIISKQDDGISASIRNYVENFLRFQIAEDKVEEYLFMFDDLLVDKEKPSSDNHSEFSATLTNEEVEIKKPKLTSMKDSVKTLALCKKINKTLAHKQKIVVLTRLWELLRAEQQFTSQRIQIINTVALAFNIAKTEYEEIELFCTKSDDNWQSDNILYIKNIASDTERISKRLIDSDGLHGCLTIIRIPSAELYFVKYDGKNEVFLNGLVFNRQNIYLFSPGSTLRLPQGAVYYSDVVSRFMTTSKGLELSFQVSQLAYTFPGGKVGLQDIDLLETSGKLIAIMGASGAGKTTLLNVLSGIDSPSAGSVSLNGLDIHKEKRKVRGMLGYIAQDDALIDELSVYENLYYCAKLCFKEKSKLEIVSLVNATLDNLGLAEVKHIKVGNPLNKKISGGQRKRLNIALELIREPAVLFVDEPTSGLSSNDSENVMDLLKELTLKGKLIFVVIHQPSSDIYKMFDKLFLLDTGGYPIYYNNPIEAVTYFKRQTNQVNAGVGECNSCGHVNPELLFNLLEAKIVDDFGNYKNERKIKPVEWYRRYKENFIHPVKKNILELPVNIFSIPGKLKQYAVFFARDVRSKLSNTQYLLINLLEAPVLALVLALLIKYTASDLGNYQFYQNDNIPAYLFVSIVVSLFIGLTVSAEEIFRDKKILKREQFLHLSKFSYLFSKISILFIVSAIQAALFVWIGNSILEIKDMFFPYWMVLFSVSCFANILGLNISVSFNSAVAIYIIIPLLVIPQMILGGAMFSFDKINKFFGGGNDRTPIIADCFASRWAFEALAVKQFKDNTYERSLYVYDKLESQLNYKTAYYLPKLSEVSEQTKALWDEKNKSTFPVVNKNLTILRHELKMEVLKHPEIKFNALKKLSIGAIDQNTWNELTLYLQHLNAYYSEVFLKVDETRSLAIKKLNAYSKDENRLKAMEYSFTNESLNDLVFKTNDKTKIKIVNQELIQKVDPIYKDPIPSGRMDFRAHFFAPRKHLLGNYFSTFSFNIIVIWSMSLLLFITLYNETYNRVIKAVHAVFNKLIR